MGKRHRCDLKDCGAQAVNLVVRDSDGREFLRCLDHTPAPAPVVRSITPLRGA